MTLSFSPHDERERELWPRLQHLVATHGEAVFGHEIIEGFGHITSSVEIRIPDARRVLRVWSKKEARWKRPGAHIESSPFETAQTEASRALAGAAFEMSDTIWTLNETGVESYWNTPAHTHLELVFLAIAQEITDLPRGASWFDTKTPQNSLGTTFLG